MITNQKKHVNSGKLPSYKNPPINEVVCGMRFHTPAELRIPHIGILWNKFREDYPNIQHAQPISSTKGELLFDIATGIPLPRVWFINKSDDQLIQFQFDRFYFNWRRRQNDYPRYSEVIKNFKVIMHTIQAMFKQLNLGELKPVELELSYINHIPQGQGWETIDDLLMIFNDFKWKKSSKRLLSSPKKVSWDLEFDLPEQNGRMNVSLKQAVRLDDKTPLLVLELKTKGIIDTKDENVVFAWYDLAHSWIVQGFTDLTTKKIQKLWEREDNV